MCISPDTFVLFTSGLKCQKRTDCRWMPLAPCNFRGRRALRSSSVMMWQLTAPGLEEWPPILRRMLGAALRVRF